MLTSAIKKYIDKSVLCWLATSNSRNEPNVSPKEVFTYRDDNTLLIAHIASPNSINNIKENPNVCVSFVDIFVQKGFKVKGIATIIENTEEIYKEKAKLLTNLFSDKYPIQAVIEIKVTSIDSIVAPGYFLFPDTTEQSQTEQALQTYRVKAID